MVPVAPCPSQTRRLGPSARACRRKEGPPEAVALRGTYLRPWPAWIAHRLAHWSVPASSSCLETHVGPQQCIILFSICGRGASPNEVWCGPRWCVRSFVPSCHPRRGAVGPPANEGWAQRPLVGSLPLMHRESEFVTTSISLDKGWADTRPLGRRWVHVIPVATAMAHQTHSPKSLTRTTAGPIRPTEMGVSSAATL